MTRLRMAGVGLVIGVTIGLGQMSGAQLHGLGLLVLAWLALYWAALLPWVLTGIFCWLWRYERWRRMEMDRIAGGAISSAKQSLDLARRAAAAPQRKRATR